MEKANISKPFTEGIFVSYILFVFFQNHPDLENLKKAHEAMMDLADYINEVKRDNEMLQIIEDIQVLTQSLYNEQVHVKLHYSFYVLSCGIHIYFPTTQ